MNYGNKSCLLIDVIDSWQTYKQKQTDEGWQNIGIWGEDLNIEGRLKTPLHTVINVDHKGVNQTTEQVENTETWKTNTPKY